MRVKLALEITDDWLKPVVDSQRVEHPPDFTFIATHMQRNVHILL